MERQDRRTPLPSHLPSTIIHLPSLDVGERVMPPTILLDSLKSVRRRVRTLSLMYGVGVLLAAAVGLLLATVLVDYLLNLPAIPRLVVILLSACALGYVLVRWIVRPMMAQLSLSDVAGRLE